MLPGAVPFEDAPRLLSIAELARGARGKRPTLEASAATLGGKGARLVWLVRHGFRVPEALVIPADVFDAVARDALSTGHDVRTLLRLAGTREGNERAGRAHARLREAPLPRWLEEEAGRAWRSLQPRAPWGLAVRSSATCEDGALSSLAGLATTRLGVRGQDAMAEAIREVWASLLLPRALSYLAGVGVHHASMAVVLQIVVAADASGVATASEPPLAHAVDREERASSRVRMRDVPAAERSVDIVVNATYGLGAPVVSGVTSPDVVRLRVVLTPEEDDGEGEPAPTSGASPVVERTIATKSRQLVVLSTGPEVIDVAPSRREQPALTSPAIAQLARACARLVRLGAGPWELEFAIAQGELWLLQARPVIEAGTPEGGDASTVWSCANLAEALPGVATPLTWSVAGTFSEVGFRRAFAALGCVVPRGTRFVSNVHGRFYLNLTAFMRVAAGMPGLDPGTLLALGGGEGASAPSEGHPSTSYAGILQEQVHDVSRTGFYARLPFTAARFLREQLRLDAELASYEKDAARARSASEALDLGILTDDGVATTLRDLQRFLDRTGTLMLTCASNALGSFVALRALIARHRTNAADATRLAEDLTSGGALKGWGDLESARPAIALVRLAEIAAGDPSARTALLSSTPPRSVDAIPEGPTRVAFDRWIAAYGDRAIREAELSTPRWREDQSFPLATLALFVARAHAGLAVAPAVREVGERADDAFAALERDTSFVERTALRHLIARCQKFARYRERMRSWVTWVLGAIRTAALEADRRLSRREPALAVASNAVGPAATTPSIFFCTMDEVLASLRGEPRSIARIVSLRRAEHARDLARPDPEVTFVGRPSPVRLEALGGPTLHGHGASPGVVCGPVRILSSPADAHLLRPGEILVTRTTDVGWTPLFVAATGVLTELGGPLSHAAIVARELGVPCVVNAAGATFRLRDGDVVRLDGQRGLVEIAQPSRANVDAPVVAVAEASVVRSRPVE